MLVTLREVLKDAQKNGYAVGLFNTVNLEMARAVLAAAEACHSPVIVGSAEILLDHCGIEQLAEILLPMIRRSPVPVVLHYDHGLTREKVIQALRCGFSSVMYDCSTSSWEDNLRRCREMAQIAHAFGASMEAELGYVGSGTAGSAESGEQLRLCTVVGFPLDYSTTQGKLAETRQALEDGADEIDMVVNLADVKNGAFDRVTAEIRALKDCVGDRVLKVIIETCYLDEAEKIRLCRCVTDGGADYIKTSTGFGTAGAALSDIALFRAHIGSGVRVKAAGGIRTLEDLEAFLDAGCGRIGTSSAVKLLAGLTD